MKTLDFLRTSVLVLGIAVCGLCSCNKDQITGTDNVQENRLKAQCEKMNTNIKSLQAAVAALQNEDYILNCMAQYPEEVKTVIVFGEADPVAIYTDVAPLVAVKKDGGKYWWTLNCGFLLDGGDKLPVDQNVPQLKVESGKWWVSCDGGKGWTEFEPADLDSRIEITSDEDNVCISFNGETMPFSKNPPAPEGPAFVFTVNEVTEVSINLDIDVADERMRYTALCMEKRHVDQFENDEELFQDDLSYMKGMVGTGYANLYEVIMDCTSIGDQDGLEIEGLVPDTEYVIYSYGLKTDGTRTTDIYREYVTTKAVEMIDVAFEIDAVVSGSNIDVGVVPGRDDIYYCFDVMEKDEVDREFGGDVAAAAKYLINYSVQLGMYYGMTAEEVVKAIASQGPVRNVFELLPDAEYVVYAASVNLNGHVNSDVASLNVVTGDITPSDNIITLEIEEVGKVTVTVSATTTNDDEYFLGVEPAGDFEGMSDDEIMEAIINKYGEYIDFWTEDGDVNQREFEKLVPETDYMVIAFGIRMGRPATPLVKQIVRTGESSDPTKCTFTISIDEIGESFVSADIKASLEDVLFVTDCLEYGYSDDELIEIARQKVERHIQGGSVSSAAEYWQKNGCVGEDSWFLTGLKPKTRYEIIAFAIDRKTGELLKPSTRKYFSTTGSRAMSSDEDGQTSSFVREVPAEGGRRFEEKSRLERGAPASRPIDAYMHKRCIL